MDIKSGNTVNVQPFNETGLVLEQTDIIGLNPQLKHIAQENKAAWLPNPVVYRFMGNAIQKQRTITAHLESSSSNIENLAIALEILQDRNYQSSPSSILRLRTTGKALGGYNSDSDEEVHLSDHDIKIRELKLQCDVAAEQIKVHQYQINKIQKKHDRTSDSSKRKGYISQLKECQKDLNAARQELTNAQQAYNNALSGASSSGGY